MPLSDEEIVDLFLDLREVQDRYGQPRQRLVLQCPTPGGFIDLHTISEGASLHAMHSLYRMGLVRLVQAARSLDPPGYPAETPRPRFARPRTAYDRLRDPEDDLENP